MTSVEELNLRLSAAKDVLVGLQTSDLALVSLQHGQLRTRTQILVCFLAGQMPMVRRRHPGLSTLRIAPRIALWIAFETACRKALMARAPPRDTINRTSSSVLRTFCFASRPQADSPRLSGENLLI
jgi:hypothetical protein